MSDKMHLPIDDMPDLAAALGRLLVHWSFLEIMLIQLTAYVLSIDVYKAKFIYEEFISTKSKIVLLRRINHHCFPDAHLKITINAFLEQALKLNSKRNSFIHAFWVVSDDTLAKVTTAPPSKHTKMKGIPEKITPQDVNVVVEEIAELSLSLLYFLYPSAKSPKAQP